MNAAGVTPPAPTGTQPAPPTVLVVDDEVLVRLTVAECLRECGFRVLEAATAEEAITILAATIEIDVVFSDVRMPGDMDGFGLSRWVREHRPGVQVLLTSGYAGGDRAARAQAPDTPMLEKPYTYEVLEQHLRRLLEKPA